MIAWEGGYGPYEIFHNLRRHPSQYLPASRFVGFTEGPDVEGLQRRWGLTKLAHLTFFCKPI